MGHTCKDPMMTLNNPAKPVCGKPRFSRSKLAKIAGGTIATRGISPWIAMFTRSESGYPFCGGSLIGNKWIITAAHCLHNELSPDEPVLTSSDLIELSSFYVILGKHRTLKKDDSEQVLKAKRFILHPEYNNTIFQHDIALVELSHAALLNDYVMPICLPEHQPQTEDHVIVSGWGKQFLTKLPDYLLEIDIPVVDHTLCKTVYKNFGKVVTEDMMCAGLKEGGKDACSGDSGGPMVTLHHQKQHWYLAGTVSWGVGCGEKDSYGVYSNVYKNLDWIKQNTGVLY